MSMETRNKMRTAIRRYLNLYLEDTENVNELFETIVQTHAYNKMRDDSTRNKERDEIYKLSQQYLRGE